MIKNITVTYSYSICSFILFEHVLFPVLHLIGNSCFMKRDGMYQTQWRLFVYEWNVPTNALHFQGKSSKRKNTIKCHWNFTQNTNPAFINESSRLCAIIHWKLLYFFFACFQFVLSNFFLFINISTTSSCSLYFPVNIFPPFLTNFFFVLLLSALHFSQFYFFMFWLFLPPHRKEISYFSICWNKQL